MALVGLSSQPTASFSPQDLPGLRLWLDAADPTSLTLSGSNVTTWNDKSGNGRNGTPVNGLTYSAASNAVVFARASSQYMTLPDNTFPVGSSSFSIFFIFTPTSTSFEIQLLTASGGNIFGIRSGNSGTGTLQTFWSGNNDIETTNLWTANRRNLGSFLYQAGGTRSLWNNGVQGVSDTPGSQTVITGGNRIGTLGGGAFNTFDGQFHEVLVFESSLSGSERQQVEGYLARKWGLLTNFPGTHPFRYGPSVILPTDIPGCAVWLDAADATTLTLSGSNVTQWRDKSGLGNNGTVIGTPVTSTGAFQGRSSVYLNGSAMIQGPVSITGTQLTAFAVVQFASFGVDDVRVLSLGTTSNVDWDSGLRCVPIFFSSAGTFAGRLAQYRYPQVNGYGVTAASNTPYLITSGFTGTTSLFYTNGAVGSTNSNITGTFAVSAYGVGAIVNNSGGNLPGYIAEVIIYNTSLTDTQRQQLEGYLAWKWGLQSNLPTIQPVLPASHPYRSSVVATRAFSPLDIDGLTFWVDATDSTTLTLSGSNVTQWSDKSGYGTHLVQNGSSNVPTYGASLISSKPALDFTNGSGLWTASVPKMSNVTLFVVAMMKTTAASWGTVWGHYSVNNHDYDVQLRRTADSSNINWHTNNDNSVVQLNVPPDVPVLFSCTMLNATTMTLQRVIPANTSSVTGTVGATLSGGSAPIWVGRSDTNEPINGYISEILYYSGVLPATQRQQVEGYLAGKWGLRASMGGPHPWRYSPPSFLPTQISGCILWLDAADSAVFNGGATWTDKSGTGNHATNGTPGASTMPTSTTWSNGLTAARFVAASKNSMKTTNTIPNLDVTYFIVARINGATTALGRIMINNVDGQRQIVAPANFPSTIYAHGTSGAPFNLLSVTQSQQFQLCVTVASGSTIGYANGTLAGSNATNTSTPSKHYFGSGDGDSSYITGDIAEVIFYNTVLSTSQRQQVEGYLAWKWGISPTLPSSTTPWLNLNRSLSPVFTPLQLPGCALWLDAADPTTFTLSGSNVTAWADKSGNGWNATAAGTPTLTTAAQNGLSVITFNGLDQYFTSSLSLGTTQPLTMFIVAKSATTTGFRTAVSLNSAPGARGSSLMLYLSSSGFWWFSGGNVSTDGTTSTLALSTSRYDINANYWRPSYVQMNINGTAYTSSTSTPSSLTASSTMMVGRGQGGTEYWNGTIAELLVYSNTLSTNQRQQVEGYLAWKWGLTPSLGGVSHPFRYGPALVTPTQFAGCVMWLDAADAATLTVSGSNVSQWNDKSGSGWHISQGTSGNRPVYNSTKKSVYFTGANSTFMENTAINVNLGTASVFLVVDQPPGFNKYYEGTLSFRGPITTGTDPQNEDSALLDDIEGTSALHGLALGGRYIGYGNTGSSTSPYIIQFTTSNGAISPAFNGAPFAGDTFTRSQQTSTRIRLGASQRGSNYGPNGYYTGNYHELIIYNTALTSAQRQQIEGYLAWKWGIQSSLPTQTHPYAAFKP